MYRIKNVNSSGDSVLLKGKYEQKKEAWLRALAEAAEEAQDIFDCLETEQDKKTLRIKIMGGNITVRCGRYLDGEKYESIYSVVDINLC